MWRDSGKRKRPVGFSIYDKTTMFNQEIYNGVLFAMAVLAVIVFFVLQKIEAPYGISFSKKWGPSVGNKTGWIVMELPAFILLSLLWIESDGNAGKVECTMASFFLLHYFQRTFIFPLLMRGRSRMSLIIVICGMIFNTVNAYLIGGWLFRISPSGYYSAEWFHSWQFIFGTILFFTGMGINLHSDHVIRNLRQPGDTRHYIPMKGVYRYVAGANYFGEFVEWTGFALLTWSLPGVVFALWTFANLAPRARTMHRRYVEEFGHEYSALKRRYIIPFIY